MNVIVEGLAKIFCDFGNELILFVVFGNLVVWGIIRSKIKKAEVTIKPCANKRYNVGANMEWDNKEIAKLSEVRKQLVGWYALYANLTAIFPLLGIIGTVAALVTYSSETMMDNFMIALSTTLLGVFAAIVFKGMDSFISGPLDILIEDADHIIQNFDEEEKNHEI